jgi:hypothetical protein
MLQCWFLSSGTRLGLMTDYEDITSLLMHTVIFSRKRIKSVDLTTTTQQRSIPSAIDGYTSVSFPSTIRLGYVHKGEVIPILIGINSDDE